MSGASHELSLLAGMSRALSAMMDDIERARDRIWIASYIVRDDRLGKKLARALAAAHERGVRVRLLFDALGSKNTPAIFIEALRRTGIGVRLYRPLRNYPIAVFPRDHARIVLVDDVGYTGGSAWGDEWLPVEEGGKGWHDVCVRVRGPCVSDLAHMFDERWMRGDEAMSKPLQSMVARHPDLMVVSDRAEGAARILDIHVAEVRRAKRRIWIENSYFFPPRAFLDELSSAARRGVDVHVLLPGPSDLPSCSRAARGEYAKWIVAGLKISEYRKTVMHSKIAVIDDDWCTVGTFNINPTSVACVHELNVFAYDRRFVAEVAEQIARDLEVSEAVTLSDVRRRSLPTKVVNALAAAGFRGLEFLLERRVPRQLWDRNTREPGEIVYGESCRRIDPGRPEGSAGQADAQRRTGTSFTGTR